MFRYIFLLSIIAAAGYFFFFGKKDNKGHNEQLIAQFDARNVVKKDEWVKGNIIDGEQIYTAHKDYAVLNSIWTLGVKNPSVIVMLSGKTLALEVPMASGQCNQLAKAVLNTDSNLYNEPVSDLFMKAIEEFTKDEKVGRVTGKVGNEDYTVTVNKVASLPVFSCSFKLK
ncbi:hypothetical protein SAMN05428958_102541 [Pantoea sesami]|nr:hypothetical protein SAMN05428958_102541 [Pantoea sesami]